MKKAQETTYNQASERYKRLILNTNTSKQHSDTLQWRTRKGGSPIDPITCQLFCNHVHFSSLNHMMETPEDMTIEIWSHQRYIAASTECLPNIHQPHLWLLSALQWNHLQNEPTPLAKALESQTDSLISRFQLSIS